MNQYQMEMATLAKRYEAISAVCADVDVRAEMLNPARGDERVRGYINLLMAQREPWYPAWGR